jgi:hypothetical protein
VREKASERAYRGKGWEGGKGEGQGGKGGREEKGRERA